MSLGAQECRRCRGVALFGDTCQLCREEIAAGIPHPADAALVVDESVPFDRAEYERLRPLVMGEAPAQQPEAAGLPSVDDIARAIGNVGPADWDGVPPGWKRQYREMADRVHALLGEGGR